MKPVFVGIDGFREGWIAAIWAGPGNQPEALFLPSLGCGEQLLPEDTQTIAVDMPIGLLEKAEPGGRPCDRAARAFLKSRSSCVFSPPARQSLAATSFVDACFINQNSGPLAGKISQQSFALFPKLREVEAVVSTSSWLLARLIEVHPEVSFAAMQLMPVMSPKKTQAGKENRRNLLSRSGFCNLPSYEAAARILGAGTDDALDACAAAWSAHRHSHREARYFPDRAEGPDHHMRIWY